MKQKQASLREAQLSRLRNDQSRSILIFTIVTIIFLPLSFFASVFGINAREWSGVETNLSLREIFLYMGAISLFIITSSILVAFNKTSRRVFQKLWHLAGIIVGRPLLFLLHRVPNRRVQTMVSHWGIQLGVMP